MSYLKNSVTTEIQKLAMFQNVIRFEKKFINTRSRLEKWFPTVGLHTVSRNLMPLSRRIHEWRLLEIIENLRMETGRKRNKSYVIRPFDYGKEILAESTTIVTDN